MLDGGDVDAVLAFRRETPSVTVDQLLRWLPLRAAQRAWLRRRITDSSSTFSLHMTIRQGHRQWKRLAVIETSAAGWSVRSAKVWRP